MEKKTLMDRIADTIQGLILIGATYGLSILVYKKMMKNFLD